MYSRIADAGVAPINATNDAAAAARRAARFCLVFSPATAMLASDTSTLPGLRKWFLAHRERSPQLSRDGHSFFGGQRVAERHALRCEAQRESRRAIEAARFFQLDPRPEAVELPPNVDACPNPLQDDAFAANADPLPIRCVPL